MEYIFSSLFWCVRAGTRMAVVNTLLPVPARVGRVITIIKRWQTTSLAPIMSTARRPTTHDRRRRRSRTLSPLIHPPLSPRLGYFPAWSPPVSALFSTLYHFYYIRSFLLSHWNTYVWCSLLPFLLPKWNWNNGFGMLIRRRFEGRTFEARSP